MKLSGEKKDSHGSRNIFSFTHPDFLKDKSEYFFWPQFIQNNETL